MPYTRWNENEIRIYKHTKHASGLEAQAAAIAALAEEIWREHFTPIIGEGQVAYMLAKYQSARQIFLDIKENDYTYFTVDTKSDGLIGYCGVVPKEGYLLLSKLYIRRDFRGSGLARGFLNEATALCRSEYGLSKIRLTVNKHNHGPIAVYQKWGFETIESVKTDIGGGYFMDDYVMELSV
ncbi:MAG: GNAT family N-acetyltransferase [Clostridiales Family XIII bacterium]|jgi:RimJ/RimL family protein N-acetyltransferase|nr:GNAT family N-acetyltransferase [Clostridiales Family XIII bacterium]